MGRPSFPPRNTVLARCAVRLLEHAWHWRGPAGLALQQLGLLLLDVNDGVL